MSISRDQPRRGPGTASLLEDQPTQRWLVFLFWSVVALLLALAVGMRFYHLALPFDRDGYDEGVYWQSLRAMRANQELYKSVFYSQPPFFLLSTFPGFALFGGSLWAARFGILLVSMLGFAGAYLLGKALIGRRGALVALLLLLVDPVYLSQSQTIQAEASSVAFMLVGVGLAFLWWNEPDGPRGICWAALCGAMIALSILSKLLSVTALVPPGLLMLMRIWQIRRGAPGTSRRSWWPILAGISSLLAVLLLLVFPFANSFPVFWSSVVTFHRAATLVADVAQPVSQNPYLIWTRLFSMLTLIAIYGSLVALLRKDWRALPLLAWLLVTLVLLYRQQPLFIHHLAALDAPLISLAVLGLADGSAYDKMPEKNTRNKSQRVSLITRGAMLLLLITAGVSFWQEAVYYQTSDALAASAATQLSVHVAADLRHATTPDQWVVTDGQFVAALADRDTPPALVDTSLVRLATGYVTLAQLEQATLNPRVHAVLFYTNRFSRMSGAAEFHAWVAAHFHLLHTYGPAQELWVR